MARKAAAPKPAQQPAQPAQPKRKRGRPSAAAKAAEAAEAAASNLQPNPPTASAVPQANAGKPSAAKRKKNGFMVADMISSSAPPKPTTDLVEMWKLLEKGLSDVFGHVAMTPREYMNYYSHVFKFCTQHQIQQQAQSNSARASSDLLGNDIYERLKQYVNNVAANILVNGTKKEGEDLLVWYNKEWTDYLFCSKVIDGIFSYLNRHWIRREIDDGKQTICLIQTLVLVIWKENLFRILGSNVTDAVLEMIQRERSGETIDRTLVKAVLISYVNIGIIDEAAEQMVNMNAQTMASRQQQKEEKQLHVYKEHFEEKFIQATREYYVNEANQYLEYHSVVEFMKKVEKRLMEERDRANFYLHASTEKVLRENLEDVLITKRIDLFQQEFGPLLEQLAQDDLARMYSLCNRVAQGLDYLRKALEEHITREGVNSMLKLESTADKDPKGYVMALLEIHGRYETLIQEAFKNETGFIQSLDKASAVFVNKNGVTMKNGRHNANKTPELLARTCDAMLRKSNKMLDENELETMLQKIMVIFKYVEDKDIFSKIHTRLFSKRLIGETSASEEAEVSFIGKLKQMCGFEYTTRMSKMISDMRTSGDQSVAFKEHVEEQKLGDGLPDFNAQILTAGSWPTLSNLALILPMNMARQLQMFNDFYLGRHSGRKLTWQLGQARGELAASCYSSKKIFMANGQQMAILMLYNTALSYTFADIVSATGMEPKNTALTLAALVKNELLKGADLSTATEFDDAEAFELNLAYKNKKVRVDLMKMVIRSAETKEKEDKEISRSVEEDRRNVIQACIVRILKMRKTIKHQQLMVEVLDQLSARFKPKVEAVKKCIAILMEKEYMRRTEDSRDVYEYMA